MADGATPNSTTPQPSGGLLGQAIQAMKARQGLLDNPTGTPPAVTPAPAPAPVDPKLIRPGFEQLDPSQWTDAEHKAFAKAHGIEKPGLLDSIIRALRK